MLSVVNISGETYCFTLLIQTPTHVLQDIHGFIYLTLTDKGGEARKQAVIGILTGITNTVGSKLKKMHYDTIIKAANTIVKVGICCCLLNLSFLLWTPNGIH